MTLTGGDRPGSPDSSPSWPIIGHRPAVARLTRGVATGRPGHAYLFVGPPRVGKTTLALAFAQALNCTGGVPPCGACRSCVSIARGTHPDVRVVGGEEGAIKIDAVRALQRELALSPFEGRWRVAILPDMERATVEASNALLKTLEEPSAQVVLVLTATDPDHLLPTIVSRCHQVQLSPVPAEEVEAALRGSLAQPGERARLLARLSGGRIGWAIQAARDARILEQREQRLDRLATLAAASRTERLAFAEQAARQAESLPELLDEWLGWWRDVLLIACGSREAITNIDRGEQLERQAARYSRPQILAAIHELQSTLERLEQNVNPRLAMEVLLLRLPGAV